MNEGASEFVVMVPASLYPAALAAVSTMNTAALPNNFNPNNMGFQVAVGMNPRLTWTTKIAVFRTDSPIKALIRQTETEAELKAKAEGSEFEFDNDAWQFGIDAWRGVGYGVAYAYAEDNLCLLAEELATVAGERSLHFGPAGKATLGFEEVDNLSSDVFFRSIIDLPALRKGVATMPPRVQQLLEGYVAGHNRFLKDAGPQGIPAECRGKAWLRPITADDMLRLNEKQMLLASSLNLATAIAAAAPPGAAAPQVAITLPNPKELGMGSNGWAFGGDVTANGRVVARGEVVAEKGRFALRIVSLLGEDGQDAPPAPGVDATIPAADPAIFADDAL
jgi:hypothetical protein